VCARVAQAYRDVRYQLVESGRWIERVFHRTESVQLAKQPFGRPQV
jgi:hypothetical protein